MSNAVVPPGQGSEDVGMGRAEALDRAIKHIEAGRFRAEGEDAKESLRAVQQLFEDRFGEE